MTGGLQALPWSCCGHQQRDKCWFTLPTQKFHEVCILQMNSEGSMMFQHGRSPPAGSIRFDLLPQNGRRPYEDAGLLQILHSNSRCWMRKLCETRTGCRSCKGGLLRVPVSMGTKHVEAVAGLVLSSDCECNERGHVAGEEVATSRLQIPLCPFCDLLKASGDQAPACFLCKSDTDELLRPENGKKVQLSCHPCPSLLMNLLGRAQLM